MNNFAVIAGTVARMNKVQVNGRDWYNLTIKTDSQVNGKTISSYIPVQVTLPNMVAKCEKLSVGSHILVEGRFESYTSTDKNDSSIKRTNYNVTQLTTLQAVDEGNVNHVMVWGRITNDIRFNTTENGNKVAGTSMANSRSYPVKDGDGNITEWKEVTSFLSVTAWGDLADELNKYEKGKAIWVTGRLNSRSYDNKDGQKVYVTDIVADSILHGGSGKHNVVSETDGTGTSGGVPSGGATGGASKSAPDKTNSTLPSSDTGFVPLDDFTDEDELPF